MYRNPFCGWLRRTVAALLGRAVEGGEVRAADAECVADFLLAALNIDLCLYQRRDSARAASACWALWGICWKGCGHETSRVVVCCLFGMA